MNESLVLQFEDVSFSFGEKSVLSHYSFTAHQNDHIVIKGRSGGGKTTILKLILGFLKPEQGFIRFYQDDKDKTTAIRRFTSWLPQELNIGEGTVQQILNYPFRFAVNKDHQSDQDKQIKVLNRLGLSSDLYTKPYRELSTGQRQRVGFALCYLLNKPLMLLDEPTSALDDKAKQKVAALLKDNTDQTIISTSHDPFWLKQATQIYELN
ncbi:ABC transporter ATP-binding protein [Legionella israelensis]|uniref:ABC transporter ATP-binding protein n=1 Tax=Legionella israelensis TaxID=454 RepID=UPI0011801499|nr:ABC transporter ATP-binding protein [Legionella israelensis]QDP71226.1 ABC transporter ATP-binding protein [Legionella israelensis]